MTNKETTILTLLKESTRANHDATETVARSNKISAGTLSLSEYKNLLICNRYIHQQLKSAFSEISATSVLKNFVDDNRLLWLESDLQALEVPVSTLDKISVLAPSYPTIPAVIGGLYVVEGSMLGGQYICKQLRNNDQMKGVTLHYYNGYGKDTGKRWMAFRQLALQEVATPEAIDACITSAKKTFDFFKSVYQIGMAEEK